MSNIILPSIVGVYCTWLEKLGDDPHTFARVMGGSAFCACCGANDHEIEDY